MKLNIFRKTREWGVREPGFMGKKRWLGEGRSGHQAAKDERAKNPQLRLIQREVKRKDKCRGGHCRDGFLCPKHSRGSDLTGEEYQLYDDRGRNLNTIRPDGEQF